MKGLKKIALATAVASVSLGAQAELQALDDSAMGNVTGQSGVTIELETKVSIGEFVYTDDGSFAVKNIVIGGETVGGGDTGKETLNDLALEIDVEDDGDAVIHVTALQSDNLVVGQDANGAPVTADVARPIDFGVATGDMELRANDGSNNSTVLLSNLKLHGDLAALDIRVDTSGDDNLSGVADSLGISVKFDIDNLDVDVPFMAVGIKGMVITGPDGDPSAVNENGTTAATDYAVVEMDIYKGQAVGALSTSGGLVTGVDNAGGDALIIDIQNVEMDVFIQDVVVGGTTADAATRSIGSVALNDMVISDTKLAVYGH